MTVQVLYHARFLDLVQRGSWEYVKRTNCSGVIAILALTDNNEIVLVEQVRPPMDAPVIELPAGLVNDCPEFPDEPEENAVRRELLEETGFEAGTVRFLTGGPPSPGSSSESINLYLATNLQRNGTGGGVDDEQIITHIIPRQNLKNWLQQQLAEGKEIALTVYSGLFFLDSL